MNRIALTPGGHRRLVERVNATRAAYRAVCDDNPAALESGDSSGWHDNFAFEENQRQMHQLARHVRDLELLLARADVVQPIEEVPERVVLGAQVTWQVDDEPPRSAWIAGYEDGDPKAGRVSYESPLGRSLLGMRVGEVRVVHLGGRERELEVLALGPAPEGA